MALSQKEFGDRLDLSESAVRNIEAGRTPSVYASTFRAMADLIGISIDDARGRFSPILDNNVEPYSVQELRIQIPDFDLAIAAGGWVDVWDNESAGLHVCSEQIRQGLFRVRVRGDSMQPRFPDGCTVEFRCLMRDGLPDFEALEVGRRYYVQLDDGTGTFKELASIQPEHLVLKAVNKKYRKPLIAPIDRVQKLAVAVGVFNPE